MWKWRGTQFIEEIGVGTACVWSGLGATNVAGRELTNVTLDLTLAVGGERDFRRTFFFPRLRSGQSVVLYLNDRAWDHVELTSNRTPRIEAVVRAWSDQGSQTARAVALLPPPGGKHLCRGKVEAIDGKEVANRRTPSPGNPSGQDRPSRDEGGVKAAPKVPSVAGTWDVTFANGSQALLDVRPGGTFTASNGSKGRWEQKDSTVRFVMTSTAGGKAQSPPLVWEGKLATDGQSFTASTSEGKPAMAKRRP